MLGARGAADQCVGHRSRFVQNQGFRKVSSDAKLSMLVSRLRLLGADFQPTDLIRFECTADPLCKFELSASVEFEVTAYSKAAPLLFGGHAKAELRHIGTFLDPQGAPRWLMTTSSRRGHALWGNDEPRTSRSGEQRE